MPTTTGKGDTWSPARIRVDSVSLDTGLKGEDMARRADQDVTRRHEPAMKVVATYPNYREAEAAVDYLSDQDFPVEKVRIVGRGLRLVEQVTGRLGSKEAAQRGLVAGALVGALFGWIFGLFDWINPLISAALLALYGLIFGAIVGALFGWLAHLALGGQRDFASVKASPQINTTCW
jgi:hypothetical protein